MAALGFVGAFGLAALARRLLRRALLRRPSCGAARRFLPPVPRAARASSSATACSSVTVSGVMSDGQRGVDAVVADIGAVAAVLDHDRPALVGMVAERAAGIGAEAAALARALAFFSAISVTARLRPMVSTSSPASRLA